MTIGGILAYDQTFPDTPRCVAACYPKIIFDSTRFESGSSVEVIIEAWGLDGGHGAATNSAVVKNWAVAFARYDLEHEPLTFNHLTGQFVIGNDNWKTLDTVFQSVRSLGYDYTGSSAISWDGAYLLSKIGDASFFFIASHGGTDSGRSHTWTDTNDYVLQRNGFPGAAELFRGTPAGTGEIAALPVRQSAIGSLLPPFNSSHKPPLSIALIWACNTANVIPQVNDFAEGLLWPYTNAYSYPDIENQACLCWEGGVLINNLGPTIDTLCDNLIDGDTVASARDRVMDLRPQGSRLLVFGDQRTTLAGVYSAMPFALTSLPFSRLE